MDSIKNSKIELCQQSKITSQVYTPNLWNYSREYAQEYEDFFTINGYKIFYGSKDEFLKLSVANLDQDFKWLEFVSDKLFIYLGNRICITPDGQVFLLHSRKISTILNLPDGPTTVQFEPPERPKNVYFKPEWNLLFSTIQEIEREFPRLWKNARSRWLKKNKVADQEKTKKEIQKTNKKIKLAIEVNKTIDILQQYLKNINDDTATQKQVGNVYHQMMRLASLNKTHKGMFPKK